MTKSIRPTQLALALLAAAAPLAVVAAPAAAGAASDPSVMIVGGGDASEAYPFAARLLARSAQQGLVPVCTATLVTYRGVTGVVTSAHCVSDPATGAAKPTTDIQVQVGSTCVDELTTVSPARVQVHPGWDWGTGDDATADLAVLTLNTDLSLAGVRIGAHAGEHRPVRLLGWNKTSVDAPEPAAVLQQLDTRIVHASHCTAARISTGELCVHGAAGAMACQGDGGGPALTRTGGGWVLLGSASRGTDATCAGPTVYTDAASYRRWIGEALTRDLPNRPRPRPSPPTPLPATSAAAGADHRAPDRLSNSWTGSVCPPPIPPVGPCFCPVRFANPL